MATHDKVATLDMVRCYSARLKEIDFFPRFHKTDVFRPFDGVLQPHSWYIVRKVDCSPERYLILNQSMNLVSGRVLAASGLTDLDIVAQITPSSVEPNTIRCALEQLYADPFNPDLKSVANITLGLCSKLGHSKSMGRYTSSANEAHTLPTRHTPSARRLSRSATGSWRFTTRSCRSLMRNTTAWRSPSWTCSGCGCWSCIAN